MGRTGRRRRAAGGGIGASLVVGASGAPGVALEAHLGLPGAATGRQAVHHAHSHRRRRAVPATGQRHRHSARALRRPGCARRRPRLPCPSCSTSWPSCPARPATWCAWWAMRWACAANPKAFSADALRAWAANPVGALTAAVPSITATGLNLIAPLLDDFLPAAVTYRHRQRAEREGRRSLHARLAAGGQPRAITVPGIPVPGIETLGLTLAISAAGLDELSVAARPGRHRRRRRAAAALRQRQRRPRAGRQAARDGGPLGRRHAPLRRALDARRRRLRHRGERRRTGHRGRHRRPTAGGAAHRRRGWPIWWPRWRWRSSR